MISTKFIAIMVLALAATALATTTNTQASGTGTSGTSTGAQMTNAPPGTQGTPAPAPPPGTQAPAPSNPKSTPGSSPPPRPTTTMADTTNACSVVKPPSAKRNGKVKITVAGAGIYPACKHISLFNVSAGTAGEWLPWWMGRWEKNSDNAWVLAYNRSMGLDLNGAIKVRLQCGAPGITPVTRDCPATQIVTFSTPSAELTMTIAGNLADLSPAQQTTMINELSGAIAVAMNIDLSAVTDQRLEAGSILFKFRLLATANANPAQMLTAFQQAAADGSLAAALSTLPNPPAVEAIAGPGGAITFATAAPTTAPTASSASAAHISVFLLVLSAIQLLAML